MTKEASKETMALIEFFRELPSINVQPNVAQLFFLDEMNTKLDSRFNDQPLNSCILQAMHFFRQKHAAVLYAYFNPAPQKAEWGKFKGSIAIVFLISAGQEYQLTVLVPTDREHRLTTLFSEIDTQELVNWLERNVLPQIPATVIMLKIQANLLLQYSWERVKKEPWI